MAASRPAALVALLAALAAAAGCSDGDGEEPAAAPAPPPAPAAAKPSSIPLAPAPQGVAQLCGIVALEKEQVLCPTRFPAKRGSQADGGQRLAGDDEPGYLIEWHMTRFRGDDLGHVTVGGQAKAFKLTGRRVSARGTLIGPLKVLRRGVKVGTARGVVVSTPPHPAGGVNGGHVAVLWNQSRRGYMTSVHFAGYPLRDRIAAAIGMARSSSPLQPGGCDPGTDCG